MKGNSYTLGYKVQYHLGIFVIMVIQAEALLNSSVLLQMVDHNRHALNSKRFLLIY